MLALYTLGVGLASCFARGVHSGGQPDGEWVSASRLIRRTQGEFEKANGVSTKA
jgi:hypothetical protein